MRGVCRAVVVLTLSAVVGTAEAQSRIKGDPARGATLVAVCASCHGPAPGAPLPGMPALAAQQPEFLVLQMFLMREGMREIPQMAGMLKDLTDRDFNDIAVYYGGLAPPTGAASKNPALRERGASLSRAMGCGSCHMSDYKGQRQVPRLTGQREDYLAATLKAYRDNRRSGTDTSMNAVMYQAADADIAALAHYFAHQ